MPPRHVRRTSGLLPDKTESPVVADRVCILQVIDHLTETPVQNAQVLISEPLIEHFLCTTDDAGQFRVALPPACEVLRLTISTSLQSKPVTFEQTLIATELREQVIVVRVPLSAAVQCVIHPPESPVAVQAEITITEHPVPTDDELNSLPYLRNIMSSDIVAYERFLKSRRPDEQVLSTTTKLDENETEKLIPLKTKGRVVVVFSAPGFQPTREFAELTSGLITRVDLWPARSPLVTGRLIDDSGKPASNIPITVASCSFFRSHEAVPRKPKSSGFVWITKGKSDADGLNRICQFNTKTDREGRFSVVMPFTENVAISSFVPGLGKAFSVFRAAGRNNSLEDLEVRFRLYAGQETRSTVLQANGALASRATIRFLEIDPYNEFSLQYPAAMTDEFGQFDDRFLEPGRSYRVTVGFDSRREARMYFQPGSLFRLKDR